MQFASVTAAVALLQQGFQKIWDTINEAADFGREVQNLSQTTGMATDSYQEWDYILRKVNYSMEQASGDMAALGEKAMDAANGVGEGAELFKEMGVAVVDNNGFLKSQEQILEDVIVALQGMTDVTKRNALASALLSTTGEQLVPILNMTADEVDGLKNEAGDMGLVIDRVTIAALAKLDKKLEDTAAVTDAQGKKMAASLAPATDALATLWQEIVKGFDPMEQAKRNMIVYMGVSEEAATEYTDMAEQIYLASYASGLSVEDFNTKVSELTDYLIIQGAPAEEAFSESLALVAEGYDATSYAAEQMTEKQAEYDAAIEAAMENYQAKSEEYTAAIESNTQKYLDQMGGIFEEFPKRLDENNEEIVISGEDLKSALQSQVDTFSEWSDNISTLSAKGVDDGLIAELREMGPKALPEIEALNKMSEGELEEYVELWRQKNELAREEALAELEPLKEEVEQQLKLVEAAVKAEEAGMEVAGYQLGRGIGDGIDASNYYIKSKARQAARAALAAAKAELGISSPSKVARDEIGINFGLGFGGGALEGIRESFKDIQHELMSGTALVGANVTEISNTIQPNASITSRDMFAAFDSAIKNNTSNAGKSSPIELKVYLDGKQLTESVESYQDSRGVQILGGSY